MLNTVKQTGHIAPSRPKQPQAPHDAQTVLSCCFKCSAVPWPAAHTTRVSSESHVGQQGPASALACTPSPVSRLCGLRRGRGHVATQAQSGVAGQADGADSMASASTSTQTVSPAGANLPWLLIALAFLCPAGLQLAALSAQPQGLAPAALLQLCQNLLASLYSSTCLLFLG